jgi:sortase (surface protein transpeptidase)
MNVGDTFTILVFHESRNYRMTVTCTYVSNQIERYWITAGKKLIVLRNDRPMAKAEFKKAIIQWKVEDGYPNNPTAFYYTLRVLEQELDKIDGV